MTSPHYFRNLKYQGKCNLSTPLPLSVTYTILEESYTLEGSIIASLRVSIVTLTDRQ